MAKIADFRAQDTGALKNSLNDLEAEYFDLKFQASLSKLENVALIRSKRRDVARLKTVIREKEDRKREAA